MADVVAVTLDQIAAATRIHDAFMPGWAETFRELNACAERAPVVDTDAVTCKAAMVNRLLHARCSKYPQLVPVIVSVCLSLHEPPRSLDHAVALVCEIAKGGAETTDTWYWSFASKFVHCFVTDSVPIYDRRACESLKLHVGAISWGDRPDYYPRFVAAIERLRASSRLACTARELDRYLWLRSQYEAWRSAPVKGRANGFSEVQRLFDDSRREVQCALRRLIGLDVE